MGLKRLSVANSSARPGSSDRGFTHGEGFGDLLGSLVGSAKSLAGPILKNLGSTAGRFLKNTLAPAGNRFAQQAARQGVSALGDSALRRIQGRRNASRPLQQYWTGLQSDARDFASNVAGQTATATRNAGQQALQDLQTGFNQNKQQFVNNAGQALQSNNPSITSDRLGQIISKTKI